MLLLKLVTVQVRPGRESTVLLPPAPVQFRAAAGSAAADPPATGTALKAATPAAALLRQQFPTDAFTLRGRVPERSGIFPLASIRHQITERAGPA